MKKIFLLLITILFISCQKEPNNIIRVEEMCFDGTYYTVNYSVITYDTSSDTWVTFATKDGVVSREKVQGGLGYHSEIINTKSKGCAGVIRIENGLFSTTFIANCQPCKR